MIMRIRFLAVTFLLAAQGMMAQPAQIILFRHGEKPEDPEAVHLSKAGEKRAKELVPFLTTDLELTKHGLPVALYATRTTRHGHGQRTQETIAPLSAQLHIPIESPYLSEEYAELAKSILANPKFHGKTVLICWTHEFIPQLATALGVQPQPPKWKDSVYDRIYLISYHQGHATLHDLPQNFSGADHSEKKKHK